MRKLTVIQGPTEDKGREFPLPEQGTLLLGRALTTNTILHDRQVSGVHCRVEVEGVQAFLVDNKSSNGTYLAGPSQPVTQAEPHKRYPLEPGCRIRLGKSTVLEYSAPVDVQKTILVTDNQPSEHLGLTVVAQAPKITIVCQHCANTLTPRPQYAGFQVRCPYCRHMVMLPSRPALAQPVLPG